MAGPGGAERLGRGISIELRSTPEYRVCIPEGREPIFVVDGTDGSGKATQTELLTKFLVAHGVDARRFEFPQYKEFFGEVIAAFLRGDYGPMGAVNPRIISIVYSDDRRHATENVIRPGLSEGKVFVLDRWTTANMAHQSARLPEEEREGFIEWLDELEYGQNGLPREAVVIFLDVPVEVSQRLNRQKSVRGHLNGQAEDLAEKNVQHQQQSRAMFLKLAEDNPHWIRIDCVDEEGNIRPIEEIHRMIVSSLVQKGLLVPVEASVSLASSGGQPVLLSGD